MKSILVDRVLDKLIQARLIRLFPSVTPENEQVGLVHESLIHNWPHYQRWLEEEELNRYRRWRLAKDAQDWTMQGRPADLLLQKRRLEEIKAYRNLSQLENEFVQASERLVEALQKQEEAQKVQLELLKNELETARFQEDAQKLRSQTLETELQAARLREASQISQIKQLAATTAKLSVQRRLGQRDRLFAILCLVAAITATGIAVLENQRVTRLEVKQVN